MFDKLNLPALFILSWAMSGCTTTPEQDVEPHNTATVLVGLESVADSGFKRVSARFTSHKSKALVFRVLSDLKRTPLWLEEVDSIETLAVYSNSQYLLRTIINSPWPFRSRELITCVDTSFEPSVTTITIVACSERWPIDKQYVRVDALRSSWRIENSSDSSVSINYRAWLEPQGNVPAFLFNQQLAGRTDKSLRKLLKMIQDSDLSQYSY